MEFGVSFWPIRAPKLAPLSQDQIRQMPMLYRADMDFAEKNCPALEEFLFLARAYYPNRGGYKYESLDAKVTMLKPGWWPCIPGWHLDDFYRPNGQPDIENLTYHSSIHLMALFGDASLTEFVDQKINLPLPPQDEVVYGFYNREIERLKPRTVICQENTIYHFSAFDFHRGMPATKSGWRGFVRLTFSNERPPKNEIRSQVQVYVPHDELFKGW